jgi:hypothetical protein
MTTDILTPPDYRGVASSSFDAALAELSGTLAAFSADPEMNAHVPLLIARVAHAAKAHGMKPERLVIAVLAAWEHEVSAPLRALSHAPDEARYRAVGTLLEAYFAGADGESPGSDSITPASAVA